MRALSYDDPKYANEKRKHQRMFFLPSLKLEIDKRRGSLSRSEWIERAIRRALQTQS